MGLPNGGMGRNKFADDDAAGRANRELNSAVFPGVGRKCAKTEREQG